MRALDTLDFRGFGGVSIYLGTNATQSVNSSLSLVLSDDDVVENVIGTSNVDAITGNALANILEGVRAMTCSPETLATTSMCSRAKHR